MIEHGSPADVVAATPDAPAAALVVGPGAERDPQRQAQHQDAEIAVAAVSHLLSTYTAAWMRWERRGHRRCQECSCYAVAEGVCPRCRAEEPYPEAWSAVLLGKDERAARLAEPCVPSSDIAAYLSPDDF